MSADDKVWFEAYGDVTVRQLMEFQRAGHPVYRTSHAGNWSAYKLLMSELGIPDRIWEPTCVHRDINNQPRYQFKGGSRIQLVSEISEKPADGAIHVTAYQRCAGSEMTLSCFHLSPLKKMYGDTVTTMPANLLAFKAKMYEVLEVIQNNEPSLFGRYILPCGCMVKLEHKDALYRAKCTHNKVALPQKKLAEHAMQAIEELCTLEHQPVAGYSPRGGILYTKELGYVYNILTDYWKHGDVTIYMISGPDMVRYAPKKSFTSQIEGILSLFEKQLPKLAPRRVHARVVPGTFFRFGYPTGCGVSSSIMAAHDTMLLFQKQKRKHLKNAPGIVDAIDRTIKDLAGFIKKNKESWDLFHNPAKDAFFSQHDLFLRGGKMEVREEYLDIPLSTMGQMLKRLEHLQINFGG